MHFILKGLPCVRRVLPVLNVVLYFLQQKNRTIVIFFQAGIRKQKTERRNVKVKASGHGEVDSGWMFTGQKRNNFRVSSQNAGNGETFNQTQVRESAACPGEVAFFIYCLESGLEWRNGGKDNRTGMLHLPA